jgi:hypothetical protein
MAKVLKDKLFGDSSKTFRPKKQQPRGTKRYDLHKQVLTTFSLSLQHLPPPPLSSKRPILVLVVFAFAFALAWGGAI